MAAQRTDSTAKKRGAVKAQPAAAKTQSMRATGSATPAVITIRDARRDLPGIVEAVASGRSRGVAVGRRGKPNAMVVSYEVFEALVSHGDKKRKLALLITEELLGEAPQHIRLPAVDELSRLPMDDLVRLFKLDSLSLSQEELTAIKARMAHPEALDRLCQRYELAATLARAREAGLYEAAEDTANGVIAESESEE
jgi:prevent-host-death family protein